MRKLFFIILITLPFLSFANDINLELSFKDCGTYKVYALAEKINDTFFITLFKNSKSEIKLQIKDQTQTKLLPYINREIESTVIIENLLEHQKGEASVLDIKDHLSAAIHLENRQGFKLITPTKCLVKK